MERMKRTDDLIRMVELPVSGVSIRSEDIDGELGTLVGYAAVFDTDTEIDSMWEGHFLERIAPGAFKKTLRENRDAIRVLYDHGFDPSIGNKPLGKPATMEEDTRGLFVEVPLDDTSYNRDLAASIRSGAIDGMSFRFSVKKEEWEDGEDGALDVRTLKEVRLFEFGPVTFPAYEATSAGVRGQEAFRAWRNQSTTASLSNTGGYWTPSLTGFVTATGNDVDWGNVTITDQANDTSYRFDGASWTATPPEDEPDLSHSSRVQRLEALRQFRKRNKELIQ